MQLLTMDNVSRVKASTDRNFSARLMNRTERTHVQHYPSQRDMPLVERNVQVKHSRNEE